MATKKKKQLQNAFYYFMLDYRNRKEKDGIVFAGMEDVADRAAPLWNQLGPHQRWIYEEEARKEKEREEITSEIKLANQGRSWREVEPEIKQALEKQKMMTDEIESTVRSLSYNKDLAMHLFYVIHVNYFCRQDCGIYTPCEIALAEFNLLNGVRKTYHTLINPRQIPLGYSFEAAQHTAETHQLPLPPEEFIGETDYLKILTCVKRFIMGQTGIVPPLYAHPNEIEAAENVLWHLQECDQDLDKDDSLFRVYPLNKLFYELKNCCVNHVNGTGFLAYSLAEKELDSDVYTFVRGISCEFHEQTDALPYCSLSCVQRWSFTVLVNCSEDLGIDLTPGNHCPANSLSTVQRKSTVQSNNHSPADIDTTAEMWRTVERGRRSRAATQMENTTRGIKESTSVGLYSFYKSEIQDIDNDIKVEPIIRRPSVPSAIQAPGKNQTVPVPSAIQSPGKNQTVPVPSAIQSPGKNQTVPVKKEMLPLRLPKTKPPILNILESTRNLTIADSEASTGIFNTEDREVVAGRGISAARSANAVGMGYERGHAAK